MAYTKQDCVDGLRGAEEMLGHEPAYHEYRELDISPSQNTIENICGSWNEAKQLAKMKTIEQHESTTDINQEYFKEIDTSEKAYWLGFLLGDGSVVDGGYRHTLKLELQQSDGHHVRQFASDVESEYKVSDTERHVPVTQATITDQTFVGYLMRAGLRPSKPTIPLPNGYETDVLRGLFDADGTANPYISYATTVESHARTIKDVLENYDIDTSVYECSAQEEHWQTPYKVTIAHGSHATFYETLWNDGRFLQRKESMVKQVI